MKQVRLETGVCHFSIANAQDLSAFLSQLELPELSLTSTPVKAAAWLYTGCVYVDGKRQRVDMELKTGSLVRLHTRPKSYVTASLKDRLVFDNADFVVLDKPPGMPTHATLDNYVENAKFLLEEELGQPLFTTHRLDIPTEGLLILAKSPPAQALINKLFAKGWVRKIYHATSAKPVPPGPYTHYIEPVLKAPRPVSLQATQGWWECKLEVETCEPKARYFCHRVRLLTGKTHQIRAQFQALGAPLIGDSLYGSDVLSPQLGLKCSELSFRYHAEKFEFTR